MAMYSCLFPLLVFFWAVEGGVPSNRREVLSEVIHATHWRIPTVEDRPSCQNGAEIPPNRVNTTERIENLRQKLGEFGYHAYIVTTDNAHQSEMVAPYDERRTFISGFTGSAGTAVVTRNSAALWTDGRYFLQAEQQLDCNWILMKDNQPDVPSLGNWLAQVLNSTDKVAADPALIGADSWLDYQQQLGNITFVPELTNLIDLIWNTTNGRPEPNQQPAFIQPLEYSGESWQDKVSRVRGELNTSQSEAIIVSALDEIAWLLNLRGTDIPYEPMLQSYVFLDMQRILLYVDRVKITPEIREHLNTQGCDLGMCVRIHNYENFTTDLPVLVSGLSKVLVPARYGYSGGSSFAIYNAVPAGIRYSTKSPVMMLKAKKNSVEAAGMINAHIKDAVALCDFISQLEEEVQQGIVWDELKAVNILNEYRLQQNGSMGASFETIAGFGPNGAVIHYAPTPETNALIDTTSLFLLDSGGQYLDGTTDVTRTFHFGQPSEEQREEYTRVLMGHVDLARLIFPRSLSDKRIDLITRRPLFEVGLDYMHGTGHGIGAFLGVHESPTHLGSSGSEENRFQENYFFSDEPGYYKDGEYGMRIESILQVVNVTFQTEFPEKFAAFHTVTLVPFEPKLIKAELLSNDQLKWINDYHSRVRQVVGGELLKQNRIRGLNWVVDKTACIGPACN